MMSILVEDLFLLTNTVPVFKLMMSIYIAQKPPTYLNFETRDERRGCIIPIPLVQLSFFDVPYSLAR